MLKPNVLIILLLFASIAHATEPGYSLLFNGTSTYANLNNGLEDVKTFSFWIKPTHKIDSSLAVRQTIFMRDNAGPTYFSQEKFGLYFEKMEELNAGKLIFIVAGTSSSAKIYSNQNSWNSNQWYHIAVQVHPTQGLKMFVNGTLQNSANNTVKSVYFRGEGSSGSLYLGTWGFVKGRYLNAQLDEFKMWETALSLAQIRANMCQVLKNPSADVKAYFQFDNKTPNAITSTNNGGISGVLFNANLTNYKKSNAPVGSSSTFLYQNSLIGESLSFSKTFSITVDSVTSLFDSPKGMHIYYSKDNSSLLPIDQMGWFGVWFDHYDVDFDVSLDYGNSITNCDSCSQMYSREHQTKSIWTSRPDYAQNCIFYQPKENTPKVGFTHREEYTLIPKIQLEFGLNDTITGCSGDFIMLTPNTYLDAIYVWDDTLFQQTLVASSPGFHRLEVTYRTCIATDSVYVDIRQTPEFYLPADTTLCTGDTLWVTAPIDSAEYSWAGGYSHDRTLGITFNGTYPLTITKDKCSFTDEITVNFISSFQINLGPDTTLCLGEHLDFNFNIPDVELLWSDGDTLPRKRIFNEEGVFWLKAWNRCFTRVDTVTVSYEECECRIFVPNSFTPNGDDLNDIFKPGTECFYEEYEFEILDRWGNFVFRSNEVNRGWDGTYNGNNSIQGVYTWRMRYKKYSWLKTTNYEYGTLTLIR